MTHRVIDLTDRLGPQSTEITQEPHDGLAARPLPAAAEALRRIADEPTSAADCSELVHRYVKDGQSARLSQAAMETLAVVAYRQPVSRSRVSAIRAVNVDGVMKTLVTRGLITEVGHDAESGAVLYATTEYFLQRLGIASLDELPPVADYLPDLADLDSPELTGEI